MTRTASRLLLSLTAMLALTACIENLDSPTLVKTPRVLAIVVEPPEAAPGQDMVAAAMFSLPDDVAQPVVARWRSCLDVESVLEWTGFRDIEIPGPRDCAQTDLAPGEPYVIEGRRTQAVLDQLRALAGVGGFDPAVVEGILSTSGLAFRVDVAFIDANGDEAVAAFKRAAFTTRAMPTTNPPPPRFRIGDTTVAGVGEPLEFRCAAQDGAPVVVPAGADVPLVPLLPEGATEEPWLESFPVFDFTGGLTTAHENAYYTWLTTGGGIRDFTTRPPDRESLWTTPGGDGSHRLWLVVRDGHLGASGCRVDVTVANR